MAPPRYARGTHAIRARIPRGPAPGKPGEKAGEAWGREAGAGEWPENRRAGSGASVTLANRQPGRRKLAAMTMFLHALILGYGVAALGAVGLSEAGLALWAVLLVAWIGANVLALGFAAIGAAIWPDKPARRSSFTATEEELVLWDEDLTRELIDADFRCENASGAAPTAAQAAAG